MRTRLLNFTRLPLAVAELLDANEVGVLSPKGPFPFALLLEMVLPGDLGVVRRIVTAIVNVASDGVVDVLNQIALHGQAANDREKTLGNAIDRIVGFGIAKLRDDVSVPQ